MNDSLATQRGRGGSAAVAPGSKSPKRERLEVETPEERQERLGKLFTSKTPSLPSSPSRAANLFPAQRPDFGPLPPSDLLARVRNFLPLLASSNETLLQRAKEHPDEVDIENVQGEGRVIEMDLGLGVFEVKGQAGGDLGPEMDIPESRPDEDEDESELDGEEGSGDAEDQVMEDADPEGSSDESETSSDDSDSSAPTKPHRSPAT